MKEKKIEIIKTSTEPKSVKNIQVFLSFANFYQHFIQSINRITVSFTSILRRISSEAATLKALKASSEIFSRSIKIGRLKIENSKNLTKFKKSAKVKKSKFTKAIISKFTKTNILDLAKTSFSEIDFFTFNIKLAFT